MLTRVEFTIDDTQWPKLHIAGQRTSTRGEKTVFDQKAQYDLAYTQFENAVHNALRPAVTEIVERHKNNL